MLGLRWDVFNVFNTVNLGLPDANIANTATVGQIRSLAGDPRIMQFSARFQFGRHGGSGGRSAPRPAHRPRLVRNHRPPWGERPP
jgi:hypothetical protein